MHRALPWVVSVAMLVGCGGARGRQVAPAAAAPVVPSVSRSGEPPPGRAVVVIARAVPAIAVAGCARAADAGGYELPAWVRRGRASASEPWPSARPSDEVRGQLQAVGPGAPESNELEWQLAQALLREADEAPAPDVRDRARTDAIRTLAVIVQQAPADPRMDTVLYQLASELQALGQPDRARQVYHRLVRAYPESRWIPLAYVSFGDFFFGQGDVEAALRFYEKVLQFPLPDNRVYGYALYRAASSLARLEQTQQARERFAQLDRLLDETPDVPDGEALRAAARHDACGLP